MAVEHVANQEPFGDSFRPDPGLAKAKQLSRFTLEYVNRFHRDPH